MTSVFSWQNSVSLCPGSFCTPKLNLFVILGIPWLPAFAFQYSMMKMTFFFFFLVLVLEDLIGLHRTVQLQLFQHSWLGHRLGLLWYSIVCLRNKLRSFCHLWDCSQVGYLDYFFDSEGYSSSFKVFLPTVVDTNFIWIKFVLSLPFKFTDP